MHELAITESLVECVCENVGDARVVRVALEIGRLSGVSPAAIRACFDACARGTALEAAALDVVEIAGGARCERCGAEFEISDFTAMCVCGSTDLKVVRGEELRIRGVEVI